MGRAREVERTVGRYEVLRELGRGGMATVFLARQTDLDRDVALKELSAFRKSDPAFVERFLRESRLAGSLNHPNIVTVLDYFDADGTPYIAMEYVSGGSLRPHIGHMSLTQVAGVLEGMLAGLEHAAHREVVHRDLKPENVMVTADGRVKITDFGIAKATRAAGVGAVLTATGMTVGTPNYMAPEQAMGKEIGPWTDLYSVGVMAFEMLVGEVPFADSEEPVAVLMRQVNDPIPPAIEVNPEIDPGISDWIAGLLVKEPSRRPQSAAEAWDELEEHLIPLVGARWRRSARLVEASRRPAEAPAGPHTTAPSTAAAPPLGPSLQVPDVPPDAAPTRRLGDAELAAGARTVMPSARAGEAATVRQATTGRPKRIGRAAKIGALVLALAVAAALALGGGKKDPQTVEAAATPATPVAGHAMSLRVPRGWAPLRSAPDVGLKLSRPMAAGPRGGGPEFVEFGMMRDRAAYNSNLLPASFVDAAVQPSGAPPARDSVRLPAQGLEAWRYRELQPVGTAGQLTMYTVPTSAGVAVVACSAGGPTCDAIAASLELRRGRPFPVGPSDVYANALNTTIGQLQQSSQAQEANLQSAQTLDEQAAAANALAGEYDAAARELGALSLSPADREINGRLVDALHGAARAYSRAAAAAGGDAGAYRAASASIAGAKAAVNSALAGLRAAGYQSATLSGGDGAAGGDASGGQAPADSPSSAAPDSSGSAPETSAPGSSEPSSDDESAVGDSKSDDPSDDEEGD